MSVDTPPPPPISPDSLENTLPEGVVCVILSFLLPHHALPLSAVSKTWLAAAKYPHLHFRKRIDWLDRVVTPTLKYAPEPGRFILECTQLSYLAIPKDFGVELCLAPDPPPLEDLHVESVSTVNEDQLADFLLSVQPTLRSLTLKGFPGRTALFMADTFAWLTDGTFDMKNLLYLNLSNSSLPRYDSVSHFINSTNLVNIEELVMSNSSLSGPPTINEGIVESCVIGPRVGLLATRDFITKPLRINMADEKRPLPLKLYCTDRKSVV